MKIAMYQMKLTNRQIQEILTDMRHQLKCFKSTGGKLQINYEMPEADVKTAQVIIEPKAWQKMEGLIQECDKEIAWHGLVEKKAKGEYVITDIIVFPQVVTGSTVTSDDTKYSMWLMNQPDEIFNKVRCHGHSHVNMGVSPSGVDTTYQEDILRNLNSFYIFMIWNKKGDNWCAIYDVESNIAYTDRDIEIISPGSGDQEWAKQMIKEYVNVPEPIKPKKKKEEKTITDSVMEDIQDRYDYYGAGYFRRFYGQS